MKSRFWWTLRDIWHSPSWHRHRMWSFTFYWKWPEGHQESPWQWGYAFRIYRVSPSHLRRDVANVLRYAYWWLLWKQPLRCNGNGGGWRTRVCEWLEEKARAEEKT